MDFSYLNKHNLSASTIAKIQWTEKQIKKYENTRKEAKAICDWTTYDWATEQIYALEAIYR